MINIIGAGLGGLALAQGLLQRGIACQVYERDQDASARAQGYRISINELGRTALQALLPKERYARLVALECREVGRHFAFAQTPERALVRMQADAWTLCRPALREVLLEEVPVIWGAPIQSPSDLPSGDLIVAADGAGSHIREALRGLAPVPTLYDTGVRTVAGLLPRTAEWDRRLPLNREGAVQYLGPRGQALFVSYCEREDRAPFILWALSQRGPLPEPDADWHPTLRELMASGERTFERLPIRSTRIRVPAQRLHPRITLLGDAAHAMPPQRGLGGNNAFADAHKLCESIGDRDFDIAGYEREMFARGKAAVAESEEASDLLHLRNPLALALRGAALRVASVFSRGVPAA